ncbi:hypothetical protein RUM44_006628 [Polyplax serrata]|uniref:Uncharacterized protein n=1 Tax=Polyplax serrata TaxID=468196 RepID=A0ABR1AIV4_POLSC
MKSGVWAKDFDGSAFRYLKTDTFQDFFRKMCHQQSFVSVLSSRSAIDRTKHRQSLNKCESLRNDQRSGSGEGFRGCPNISQKGFPTAPTKKMYKIDNPSGGSWHGEGQRRKLPSRRRAGEKRKRKSKIRKTPIEGTELSRAHAHSGRRCCNHVDRNATKHPPLFPS